MPGNPSSRNSRGVLLATGYSVLFAAFGFFGVLPFVRGTAAARADITRFENEIAARQNKAHALEEIKTRIHVIDLQTHNFDRLIPANPDQGPFQEKISEALDKAGMHDVSKSTLQSTPLGKSERLPIVVHARGTFAQFHGFLVSMEKLQRMSSIGKLSIEADNDMNGNITAELTLYIYNTNSKSGS